jgi:outer membrane lipoprotein-sorting protein
MALSMKAAALLLVTAGGLSWFLGGLLPVRTTLAFAEVAEVLRDAHTLAYRVQIEATDPDGKKQTTTMKYFFKEPGRMRGESTDGKLIAVFDQKKNKALFLDPKARMALLTDGFKPEGKESADEFPLMVTEQLRKLVEKKGEPVGKKTIGDVEARGFRVKEDGRDLTVWADPKTRQPLLVETTVRVQKVEARITLSDFELNPKLDDSLFSLEPPEGYRLTKLKTGPAKPENDVARLLRAYAEAAGGAFPPRLDDWGAYEKAWKDRKFKGPADPEMVELVQVLVRVNLFLLKVKGAYGYRADGVKLGDREQIVFWYKPEGATKYRAVFGDLHTADVSADQLPEKPK